MQATFAVLVYDLKKTKNKKKNNCRWPWNEETEFGYRYLNTAAAA